MDFCNQLQEEVQRATGKERGARRRVATLTDEEKKMESFRIGVVYYIYTYIYY